METYSSPQTVTFMYFWLNYCDENIERIPVAVKDLDHLFNMARDITLIDNLHLLLLSHFARSNRVSQIPAILLKNKARQSKMKTRLSYDR